MGAPREPTGAPREHQWEHHGGITRAHGSTTGAPWEHHGSTTGANSGANFSDTGPAGPAQYPNRKIVENPMLLSLLGGKSKPDQILMKI